MANEQTIRIGQRLIETLEIEYKVVTGAATEARFIGGTLAHSTAGIGSSVEEARADLFYQHSSRT